MCFEVLWLFDALGVQAVQQLFVMGQQKMHVLLKPQHVTDEGGSLLVAFVDFPEPQKGEQGGDEKCEGGTRQPPYQPGIGAAGGGREEELG